MKNHQVTSLELKLLDELIRPALTEEKQDFLGSNATISQTLSYSLLLKNIRKFYSNHGGKDWFRVLYEYDKLD